MRISDWNSDVCSSDLQEEVDQARHDQAHQAHDQEGAEARQVALRGVAVKAEATECGRACKEGRSDRRARVNEEDRRQRQAHRHGIGPVNRSEEQTSELQSLMRISYAVLCLTKKK